MSKYGTFPASPTAPSPDVSPAALNSTSCAEQTPGVPSAAVAEPEPVPVPVRRPWRELADPRALSVPRGLAAARHRARANLARFAASYEVVLLVAVWVALLWRPAVFLPVVVLFFFATPGKRFRLLLMWTPLLLLVTSDTGSVLISLPVGLLLVVAHAVLHLPEESDGSIDDEEAARLCYKPGPP